MRLIDCARGFVLINCVLAYIEIVEEFGCQDTEFRLTCRHLDSQIAILSGTYYPEDASGTISCRSTDGDNSVGSGVDLPRVFADNTTSNETGVRNLRYHLNRRCSGLNYCSFVLDKDVAGAHAWAPGLISLRYACVSANQVVRYCNQVIKMNETRSEGFIQSPGYPKFYLSDKCKWQIVAPKGQKIQIVLMDVSLRSIGPHETNCSDTLNIYENDQSVLGTCDEYVQSTEINSNGRVFNVEIDSNSKPIYPKRGVLMYYKAVGCPTLAPPKDGYLEWRNDTTSRYMCYVGYFFSDTWRRSRTLNCLKQNTWDMSLPACISNFDTKTSLSNLNGIDNKSSAMVSEANTLYDIVIPTSIIVSLFIINAIIVFIIYKYKKSRLRHHQEEEMAVIGAEESSINIS